MPETTACRFCGLYHGPRCPLVKALEYHPDGTLRRVEFVEPQPAVVPSVFAPATSDPMMPPYRVTYSSVSSGGFNRDPFTLVYWN